MGKKNEGRRKRDIPFIVRINTANMDDERKGKGQEGKEEEETRKYTLAVEMKETTEGRKRG